MLEAIEATAPSAHMADEVRGAVGGGATGSPALWVGELDMGRWSATKMTRKKATNPTGIRRTAWWRRYQRRLTLIPYKRHILI